MNIVETKVDESTYLINVTVEFPDRCNARFIVTEPTTGQALELNKLATTSVSSGGEIADYYYKSITMLVKKGDGSSIDENTAKMLPQAMTLKLVDQIVALSGQSSEEDEKKQ